MLVCPKYFIGFGFYRSIFFLQFRELLTNGAYNVEHNYVSTSSKMRNFKVCVEKYMLNKVVWELNSRSLPVKKIMPTTCA
mmetsp:Transcript_30557/g.34743  ORF Transcript_30557/g.34743 Transcript_30557/m.34743 type:complete len:80 (+) Transcript_30557:517-756(+)